MVEPSFTIVDIQEALNCPLPGIAGQIKMAPERPAGQPNRWDMPEQCRQASVLLLLYPHSSGPDLHLILTRRPDYPGVHGGQISFPGGQREGEESLRSTALRETNEEIGVSPDKLSIVGHLSPLYIPPSNYCIYPFVAYSPTPPTFRPNSEEVAEIIETPLRHFLNPSVRKEAVWYFHNYGERFVPFFDVFGHRVWGATAMILSEFLTLLDCIQHRDEVQGQGT